MEIVSSVIDTIKQRLRNPFIFSFIVGWLTYNWQITMSFIWFKSTEVDIVQLIRKTATGWDSFWIPIAIATFYTFVVPYISIGIEMFNATIVKWNNNRVFKISKDSYVSFEKYFKLRDNYKKKEDRLAEMIQTEESREELHSERERKIVEIQKLVLEKDAEISEKNNQINSMEIVNSDNLSTITQIQNNLQVITSKLVDLDRGIFKGWKITYFDDTVRYVQFIANLDQIDPTLTILIMPKIINHYWVIESFTRNNRWTVVASSDDQGAHKIYYYLTYNEALGFWTGFENNVGILQFEEIK